MAMPRSITVVHAGLSGAFSKTIPRIPSSGTCNHQGMPYRPRIPGDAVGRIYPGSCEEETSFTFFHGAHNIMQLLLC